MKKAIDILLKVGKIVDIVVLVIVAISTVIVAITGTMAAGALLVAGTVDAEAEYAVAIAGVVAGVVQSVIYLVLCIVALVLLKKIRNGYAVAKNKEENKKWAIMAIVTGALSTGFVLVAGILMLILPEDQLPGYGAAPVAVKSESVAVESESVVDESEFAE